MNKHHLHRLFSLLISAGVAACSAPSAHVVATPVRAGMSSAEVLSRFGRPLRIEQHRDGSEDWFYNFGSQKEESRPVSETTTSEAERSYSFGQTTTTTTTTRHAPIHLRAGHVIGPIPPGRIVIE